MVGRTVGRAVRGMVGGTVHGMVSLATLQTPIYMVRPLRPGVWRVAALTILLTVPTAIPPTVPLTIEAGAHPNVAGAHCKLNAPPTTQCTKSVAQGRRKQLCTGPRNKNVHKVDARTRAQGPGAPCAGRGVLASAHYIYFKFPYPASRSYGSTVTYVT